MARAASQAHLLAHRNGFYTFSIAKKELSLCTPSPNNVAKDSTPPAIRSACPTSIHRPKELHLARRAGRNDWYSPSYNPRTKLFYLSVWENRSVYRKGEQQYSPGNRYIGSVPLIDLPKTPAMAPSAPSIRKPANASWNYISYQPWPECFPPRANSYSAAATKGISSRSMRNGQGSVAPESWRILRQSRDLPRRRQAVRKIAAGSALFTFALAREDASQARHPSRGTPTAPLPRSFPGWCSPWARSGAVSMACCHQVPVLGVWKTTSRTCAGR